MQKWEYRVEIMKPDDKWFNIDQLGQEGWELVSAVPWIEQAVYFNKQSPIAFGGRIEQVVSELQSSVSSIQLKLFFKRPKVSQTTTDIQNEVKESKRKSKK